MTLFTVGHSTRPIDELVALLQANQVALLADVRSYPRSKRHPQFDTRPFASSLSGAGIAYRHCPELGGMRRPCSDSRNRAWPATGFRGYADYMQTPAFESALERLIERASRQVTAIMCAEAEYTSCHRQMIADALTIRAIDVLHIGGKGGQKTHRLTATANVEGLRNTYPAPGAFRDLWEG